MNLLFGLDLSVDMSVTLGMSVVLIVSTVAALLPSERTSPGTRRR